MRSFLSIVISLVFLYFLSTEGTTTDYPTYFKEHLRDTFLLKERFHTDTVFLSSIDKKLHFKRLKYEHTSCNCKSYKIVNGETIEAGSRHFLTAIEILIPIDSVSKIEDDKFKVGQSKHYKILSKLN